MIRRFCLISLAIALAASLAPADFSYEQTSKISGGAMIRMMSVFSKQMREPTKMTMLLKGDRMAMVMPKSAQVIDLAKETMTEINFERKTYSVTTFAQWSEAMKNLAAKMKNEKGESSGEMTMKVSVQPTTETRTIGGYQTKKSILRMEFEGTDKKTGEKGTMMTMLADMWLAPDMAGYGEVKSFYLRMAQKLDWSPNSGMLAALNPGGSKGMAEMTKEMSKLNGIPVFQFTRMIFGTPEQAAAAAQQQQPSERKAESEEPPTSLGGIAGRLGGRFGGFGKKKKKEEPKVEETSTEGAPPTGEPGAGGSFMELTSELTAFSSAPVDASKFEVPAGFKQVESEFVKMSRR